MKTWLKGGLIGSAIGLFSILFWFGIGSSSDRFFLARIFFNFYVEFIGKLFLFIIPCSGEGCIILIFIGPVLTTILFGLIGAIIGLIIQKIKSK